MIEVVTFYAQNDLRNYSYLVIEKETGSGWVIDPFDARPILQHIKKNGISLKGILNTHQHWDHIRGNDSLIEAFHPQIFHLKDHQKLELGPAASLEILDTPGHTLDHQVFVWKEEGQAKGLFSGDTLFNSGVGNCRNGGNVDLLYETTRKLMNSLPASTTLFPGHDYRRRNLEFAATLEPDNSHIREELRNLEGIQTESLPPATLGEEVKVNPFLRLNSEELRETVLKTASDERELFIKLRQLRDQW